MLARPYRVIAVGVVASHLVGCGAPALTTVVSGRYDEVIISTTPSNVSIYDEIGARLAVSPAKLTIARKNQPPLQLRKNGFQDTTIILKRRVNRLIPLSFITPMVGGALISALKSSDGQLSWWWFLGGSAIHLTWCHLPDYFLGGAWDHKREIDVLMKKKEAD